VGTRGDKVYAVPDRDRDGEPESVKVLLSGLNSPNGVAVHGGDLYVAEIGRVLRYPDIEKRLDAPPEPVVVNDTFPEEEHHGWKYIRFSPQGLLHVPVGAPCNICESEDPRFASIMRMRRDGSNLEIYARGIRNTVGFDFHPETGELWLTNNGRDWMGDHKPPDTLHRVWKKGLHFGFPYCHAGSIPDPEYGDDRPCDAFADPVLEMPAHVAPLGMSFYTAKAFPREFRGNIFMAEHGSWNRSTPIGYRVTMARLQGNRVMAYSVFARGWLQDGDAWGRPVDVKVDARGDLLVSDDRAGAVYRIRYTGGD
jgi:glucose/arabinose dehydrogenase